MRKRAIVALACITASLAPSTAFGVDPTAPTPCPNWVDQTRDGTGKAVPVWTFQEPPAGVPAAGDNYEMNDTSGLQQSKDQGIVWTIGDRANNRPDITHPSHPPVTGEAASGIASNWAIYAHDVTDGDLEAMYKIDPSFFLTVDNTLDGAAEFPDVEELAIDYRTAADRLYVLDIGDDSKNRGKAGTINATNYPVVYRFDEPIVNINNAVEVVRLTTANNGLRRYDLKYYNDINDAIATQVYVNGESGFFDAIKINAASPPNNNLFILARVGENLGVGSDGVADDHPVYRIANWVESDGGTSFTRVEQVAVVDVPMSAGNPNDAVGNAVFGADMKSNNQSWVVRNGERAFVWNRYVKDNGDWINVGAEMNAYPLAEELPSLTDQSCSSTIQEFDYIPNNNNEEAIAFRYPNGGGASGFYGSQDQTLTPQLFNTLVP